MVYASLPQEDVALESLVAQVADEFLERQRCGEKPTAEEYAARHPEAAELLRKVLASLEIINQSRAPGDQAPGLAEEPSAGILGDFRIMCEIGRGGMGIVYEAEQISLGRRVALKVLPFAATMDPRQLQRFHNEARAAACLQHPHIVPVYAVGCERSVHFYAMQLIDGQPLDRLLDTLRGSQKPRASEEGALTEAAGPKKSAQPSSLSVRETIREVRDQASTLPSLDQGQGYFRRIAELIRQAAEALEHAHLLGIVHRDVKPANLLLDTLGNVWMTDFGLAQIQSDARLTMTGDLVGTLRYMSPEQALAQRVVIDHRTDVYSLGATLYELLTLAPVFGGRDRQEVLRQIAFEDPRPPRRLNKSIPTELETIVLKAMEKNPADRYATAQALADDLRRFLQDETIRARRPALGKRVMRWSRKHRPLVAAAASVLAVAVVLAGSVGWVVKDRADQQTNAEGRVAEALEIAEAKLLGGNPHDPELVTAAQG